MINLSIFYYRSLRYDNIYFYVSSFFLSLLFFFPISYVHVYIYKFIFLLFSSSICSYICIYLFFLQILYYSFEPNVKERWKEGEPKIQKVAECQSGKNRSHIIEKRKSLEEKYHNCPRSCDVLATVRGFSRVWGFRVSFLVHFGLLINILICTRFDFLLPD